MPSTVAGLMRFAAERYPDVAAVRWKEDGEWHDRSYAEVASHVERVALGLIDHGIEPGDRVCVLADTSPEWASTAFAIWPRGDRRADLPDQLARGVRVGGRQLGGGGGDLRDRRPSRKLREVLERLPSCGP